MLHREAICQYETPKLSFMDFVARFNIRDCSLIKMDIEGAELFVLPTMIDFLVDHRPSLLLSLHGPMWGEREGDALEVIYDILRSLYDVVQTTDGRPLNAIRNIRRANIDLIATCTP